MTVVLTTHYLDEADEADQIYIVDHGEVIAQGSALDIKVNMQKHLEDSFQGETADRKSQIFGNVSRATKSIGYIFQPKSEREAIDYLAPS